jgi:hypothetical protein
MLRRSRSLTAAVCAAGALVLAGPAQAGASNSALALGRHLVKRFFSDAEHSNIADLDRFLSPAFQVQRADGSRETKTSFIIRLPTIRSFKLRRFQVTATGHVVVATYESSVDEVIGGRQFRSGFAPRISVFVKGPRGWQMVAHSNFNKPK